MPTFADELYENRDQIAREQEPNPDALETYLATVTRLVPNMNKEYLEKNFGVMNHEGNSRTHDEETTSVDDDSARDEHQVLYEGGKCVYDPYFLHGFARFGEVDPDDPFGE